MISRKQVLFIAATAFAVGALYLGAALWVGLEEVASAWRQGGAACVAAGAIASLFGLTLRTLRWQLYLRALGHPLPLGVVAPIYLAGLSLTTIPGKIGEMIRCVFLRRYGVSYASGIAAFIADRLADLLGVLAVAGLLAWQLYPDARLLLVIAAALALMLILFSVAWRPALACLQRIVPRSWLTGHKLAGVASMLHDLRICVSPGLFAIGLAVGMLAYSAQGVALAFVVMGMGGDIPVPAAILSFLLSTLGGAVFLLPAGLGGMEAALVALLVYFGLPLALGVAATILIRLTTLWFVILVGLGCLVWVQVRASPVGSGT